MSVSGVIVAANTNIGVGRYSILLKVIMCHHTVFNANTVIHRVIDNDTIRFIACLTVVCVDCGTDFVFTGLPAGISSTEPTISIDGREARLLMAPKEIVSDKNAIGGTMVEKP